MHSVFSWGKVAAAVIAISVLGGCSLVHSELGTVLKEKQSYKEWTGWDYAGNASGNRNAYAGKN